MDLGIEGKVALVTAASRGLGFASAAALAAEGCRIAICARDPSGVERAVAELSTDALGADAFGIVADVTEPDAPARLVRETVERFGGLDILVANAGGPPQARALDVEDGAMRDALEANLLTSIRLVQAALPHLRAAKGRAIYVSASSIDRPLPGMGVYAASKYALETMVKAWQAEHPDLCFANVRVGSALGTGVTDSWDRELLVELSQQWAAGGYVHDNGPGGPMTVEQAASAILAVLDSPVWLRDVTAVSDPGRENYQL